MSMHTPQEWHQHSSFNMTQSQQSHKRATRQNDTSSRAHDETVSENLGRYNALSGQLQQKIADSSRLVDSLQRRAESLENSIQKTYHSLAQLEAAYQAKEPQIQLCLWRMSQREKRPLREQVRDNPECTLEAEKTTLVDTQKRLSDAIKRTKACITLLEDKLAEVRHDIDHKVQALHIDETCLRTTQRSHQTAHENVRPCQSLNGTAPSSHRAVNARMQMHETTRNEGNRQQEAMRLTHSGSSKEEKAKGIRDDNQTLIARCQKAADEALSKTERQLQERCSENQQMRQRLEADIRDTNAKISHTKDTMAETKAQIRALEEPMDNAAACASYRRQRATREHVHDPVSTRIQEHQMSTHRAHQDLTSHHAQEKVNLQDLNERLARLQEDLRDKTASLNIDQNCLTHQTGHHTLSSAPLGATASAPMNYSAKSRLSARRPLDFSSVGGSMTMPFIPHTTR